MTECDKKCGNVDDENVDNNHQPLAERKLGEIKDKKEKDLEDGEGVVVTRKDDDVTVKCEAVEKMEDSHKGIPVDRGYAWVICFCVSLLQMLVFGHNRALATWFVDIREEFQQSQTVTSLTLSVFALSLAVSSLMSSNVFIKLFPIRAVCVCASFCSSVALLISSQAPHIGLWLACYILRGLCGGVLLIIPMSQIGFYFKERRALASSLASMGMVIGNIVFPPFASLLIQTFGLRGALLMMVGLELQMIPLSMLLRPHTSYTKHYKKQEKLLKETSQVSNHKKHYKQSSAVKKDPYNQTYNYKIQDSSHHENNTPTITMNTTNASNTHHNETTAKYTQPTQALPLPERDEEEEAAMQLYFYSSSAPAIANAHLGQDVAHFTANPHLNDYPEYKSPSDNNEKQNQHSENDNNNTQNNTHYDQNEPRDTNTASSNNYEHEQEKPFLPLKRMLSYDETSDMNQSNKNIDRDLNRSRNNSGDRNRAGDYLLSTPNALRKRYHLHPEHSVTSYHSSQMSIAALGSLVNVSYIMMDGEEEKKKESTGGRRAEDGDSFDSGVDDVDDDSDDEEDEGKPTFRSLCKLSTFFDVSLFKSWLFRMLAAFMATSAACILLTVYLPVLAVEAGLERSDGSLLLTIGGSVDLVARPFIGWLADKNIVSKEKMVAFSLIVVAVITQFGRYYTTFPLFVMFTVIVCLFAGFRANLFHAIAFDYFGPVRAPKVFALAVFATTIFMAANHPIFGALIDNTGSHVIPLHYVGGVAGCSALVMMLQPVFAKLDRQNEEKEEKKKNIRDA